MKVRSLFHPYVVCATPWDTLTDAARLMRKGGFSCLPIFAHDELVGIITERDLVDAVANGGQPAKSRVVDYMNEAPVTVGPDDDSAVAATRMLALGCRHLPVVEDGKLIGIVSARDLLLLAAHPTVEVLRAV
jgi:CBS domain-containing protein